MIDKRFETHTNVQIRNTAKAFLQGKLDPAKIRQFETFANKPERTEDDKRDALELLETIKKHQDRATASQPRVTAGTAAPTVASGPNYSTPAASPSLLGQPFHNPYTFIPFGSSPKRSLPTPLTKDEVERDRFTGVIRIEFRTLSPLLSPDAKLSRDRNSSDELVRALKAGQYPIVPASGVRGTLRTLLTVLTGGTLGYVDESLYLTQGRDAQLGPRGRNGTPDTPEHCFIGEVTKVGTALTPGLVRVAKAELLTEEELRALLPFGKSLQQLRADKVFKVDLRDGRIAKLSGRKFSKGVQRDGVFNPKDAREIELNPELWNAYAGRHRHAEHNELKVGDLVWIEPRDPATYTLTDGRQVKSIQWARWGRRGTHLLQLIREKHDAVFPDSMRDDGLVDEIVNLFGQVAHRHHPKAPSFAGRVRPDNLVFARETKLIPAQLSPLLAPHPGCMAFYRKNIDPEQISASDPLRGYKVYRNTKERGDSAPWLYQNAPVFDRGAPKPPSSKISRKAELLPEGSHAHLSLSVRSLSQREVALLLLACSVDWKLGGGKPLGLGHCRPVRLTIVNEFGDTTLNWEIDDMNGLDRESPAKLPAEFEALVADLAPRAKMFQASQRPVEKLRYPRAVSINNQGEQRGGQVWFQRHAQPKKGTSEGLERLPLDGELRNRAGRSSMVAQMLPVFSDASPFSDVLYGYDLGNDPNASKDRVVSSTDPVPPRTAPVGVRDPNAAAPYNRDQRQRSRDNRRSDS